MRISAFWIKWPAEEAVLYRIFLGLSALAMLYCVAQYLITPALLIDWYIETDIRTVKTVFDRYYVGLYTFPILVENYLALQTFLPNALDITLWPSIVHLIFLAVALSAFLAVATTLRKFYYIIGMVAIAAVFLYTNTDILKIFGHYNKAGLVAAIIIFFPASYYIHSYRTSLSLSRRVLVFLFLMSLYVLFLLIFSGAKGPVLHLSNYGMYPPLVLSVVFIFMVGHEPYSTFLHLITRTGRRGGKHLFHFLAISFIYLLNVLLVYLRNSQDIDVEIYTINAYWLLLFATIAGVWGYRRRSPTYAGIFPFRPTGALIYLSLSIVTFSTIAYLMARGQDSLLEMVEDAIMFSQLGYGAMFILYVIANFYTQLYKSIDISSILYKPPRMPYFISKFAGVIVILGLFLRANLVPYYQAVSGYHSGLGDIYYAQEDFAAAREYYKIAGNYSSKSHRANYALANIAENEGKNDEALLYYRQSVQKNPTEYAYSKIARMYWLRNMYFDAIFTLREGLAEFPDSGPLHNNLAILYTQTDIVDSTLYFLEQATHSRIARATSNANKLAVYSMKNDALRPGPSIEDVPTAKTLALANNKVVYAAVSGQPYSEDTPVLFAQDMKNSTEQILYNYNKALLDPLGLDTTFFHDMTAYYDTTGMAWMLEPLQAADALAAFMRGNKTTTFERLYPLSVKRDRSGAYYSQLLGKLSLSSDAPRLAIDYFEHAASIGLLKAVPEYTFALMETGQRERPLALWQQILNAEDSTYDQVARDMLFVLGAGSPRDLMERDPVVKYQFIRYRHQEFDPLLIEGLILSFDNDNYRAIAYIDLALRALAKDDTGTAERHFNHLTDLQVTSPEILAMAHQSIALYYVHQDDMASLQELYDSGKLPEGGVRDLADACLASFRGDHDKAAGQFNKIGFRDPFFEAGVVRAAEYFDHENPDDKRAYDILLNAININRYSTSVREAYMLQSLEMGLEGYAEDALAEYREMVDEKTYMEFMEQYEREKKRIEREYSSW